MSRLDRMAAGVFAWGVLVWIALLAALYLLVAFAILPEGI